MKLYLIAFGLLFLTGCQTSEIVKTDRVTLTDTLDYSNESLYTDGESNNGLPMKKLVIDSASGVHEFEVEVAHNEQQRQEGLMHRTDLDDNRGMLFIFDKSGYVNFWMKNTLIPLDMLFINKDGYIENIEHNAPPCSASDDNKCPKFNSDASVKYVLEINGGLASKLGLKKGDKVTWL